MTYVKRNAGCWEVQALRLRSDPRLSLDIIKPRTDFATSGKFNAGLLYASIGQRA